MLVDRDLVEQAQQGDREAFAILARTNGDRLFALAHRILRDIDRAEDAVQQTLVIAWRQLPQLREADRFDAWLHRILVHSCYAEATRARRWSANIRVLSSEPSSPSETSVEDRDQIERGFRRLPPEQRAVLALHHYIGLSLLEIAETLGIPDGTARSRLHYAHRAMRAVLEADDRPAGSAGGRSR
jgi:RNA polymerase sigma-70 factor (ECF subfamily)